MLLLLSNLIKPAFAASTGVVEKYQEANSAYLKLAHDSNLRKNKASWLKVVQKFDDIANEYPESSLAPKSLYMKGKLYEQIYGYFFGKSDLEKAVKAYKSVISKYPDSKTVPDALFREAKIYEVRLGEKKKSIELYHEILKKYPRGEISLKAREALNSIEKNKSEGEEKASIVDKQEGNDLKQKETKQSDKTLDRNEAAITVENDNTPSQGTNGQSPAAKRLPRKISNIVIDPGRGGRDLGAIGPHGEMEKDITLAIGKTLANRLREQGFEVFLTRDEDIFIPLEKRIAFANKKKADLFISIHLNSNPDQTLDGVETYFLNMTTDDYAIKVASRENETTTKSLSDLQSIINDLMLNSNTNESSRFATYVQDSIMESHQRSGDSCQNHGVKQGLFFVLVGAQMPAILIETGFITNPVESKLLEEESYQNSIIDGIIHGIHAYANDGTDSGENAVRNNQSDLKKKGSTNE
jgi:N-acetylmuramoyl-L-alanine amidase